MPFPKMNPALERALAEQGYAEPTPVQAAVLAADANDQDLLVSAQTGSGKTVAFGLALAETLLGERETFGPSGPPVALVIAPTRELAMQVQRELVWLYGPAQARVVACVGGMDPQKERRALAAGCHVVVGTPGRLRDHLERGALDVSALSVVVLDEADEMLDLGFREDLEFILDAAPEERRSLLFSATIAREIIALAKRFQKNALRIDTTVKSQPHGDIEYRAIRVAPNDVEHAVVNLLRYYESPGALVFCATREGVKRLHGRLAERGFAAVALSGELTQNERTTALQALRDGRARVCVATDVAARGLDLPDLGLVIHADLPQNRAAMLHRSGRTGRAGKKGVSVLIVPYNRRRQAETLLNGSNVAVVWGAAPKAEEIRERDQARLIADPIFTEEPGDDDGVLAAALLEGRTPMEIASALIRLHRSRLPAPEELFEEVFQPPARERPPRHERGGDYGERSERGERGPPPGAMQDGVWFRMTVGRSQNADPKWLIPLICRLGHVTKKDIGSIRIFARETRFEISPETAPRFTGAVKATAEEDIRIEPAGPPPEADSKPPHKAKPYLKRHGPPGKGPPGKGPPKGPPGKAPYKRRD
jgi:ATP-dependent RNA helicase DeaD